jgi:hypothetical protein
MVVVTAHFPGGTSVDELIFNARVGGGVAVLGDPLRAVIAGAVSTGGVPLRAIIDGATSAPGQLTAVLGGGVEVARFGGLRGRAWRQIRR